MKAHKRQLTEFKDFLGSKQEKVVAHPDTAHSIESKIQKRIADIRESTEDAQKEIDSLVDVTEDITVQLQLQEDRNGNGQVAVVQNSEQELLEKLEEDQKRNQAELKDFMNRQRDIRRREVAVTWSGATKLGVLTRRWLQKTRERHAKAKEADPYRMFMGGQSSVPLKAPPFSITAPDNHHSKVILMNTLNDEYEHSKRVSVTFLSAEFHGTD